jgi:3-phenylpropionate/trans-cinnamate dioxygenase ferredoxin subunit
MLMRVCRADDIPDGEVVVAKVEHLDGRRIAVFNVDGEFLAIDDRCSHQEAALSDGFLEGCAIECPLHASSFDLRTGEPSGPPATRPVRTYATSLIDGMVHVAIPGSTEN